ncbi:3-deoxy-D-manno-octulosonic acid kinase [Pseudoalteromonas denitrificans]|uniref:3-deoxy-D-manno-octulosonic acid kinase n=1 Tax=Pseudoalteromonas denitrificans DSM 6059 TaxID=1123010 RepID=A0A1I1DU74_9GAMM|nr:3-deoxy-D-manno-octulosonic acid kinase [Pseudoalteromonas denitrificans]SFB78589.1 3-deoxy-D-manno-octulosonic acid kinase [Pseudoalteromonas denitrificans DSM 6059]
MNTKVQKNKNHYLLSWQLSPTHLSSDWFQAQYWKNQNKIYAQKKGRASVWFFEQDNLKAVLRHYWRGGLIGKLLQDQYLYLGFKKTRVFQEFELLTQLHQQGLNVPVPVGAYIHKIGLIYRGDIITQAIQGAASLLDILKHRELTSNEITQVALCISTFHQQGVYHADLNINNILFNDEGEVFLIDFDRGELRTPQSNWQQANINRLERSFEKEKKRNKEFYWQTENWSFLKSEYKKSMF